MYGHRVIVETDDKLLESIFLKPLNEAPPRLQRMLLKLTKYDVVVRYVLRKLQVISDCLSRVPLSETEPFSEPEDVVGTNLVEELGLESSTLSVEDGMLFQWDRIVVPRLLRVEVLDEIHGAHMGESKSLSIARDYVFWPSMTAQIKDKESQFLCHV